MNEKVGTAMRLPSAQLRRMSLRPEWVVWPAALYAATILNIPFWKTVWAALTPDTVSDWALLAVLLIDVTILIALLLGAFAYRRAFAPAVAVIFLIMASASFYMMEFGAVFDSTMIRNIVETDRGEAFDLLSTKLFTFLAVTAIVPAALISRIDLEPGPFWLEARRRLLATGAGVVAIVGLTYPMLAPLMSVTREHSILRYQISPFNLIVATANYTAQTFAANRPAIAKPAVTAARAPTWKNRNPKSLLVIVVGETARASSFSLNGYGRNTNPRLATVPDLVSFTNAASCGTATATSLPCMFSGLGRSGFSFDKDKFTPNLIDHLHAAGFNMLWRDNQSGCKGVCAAIPTENLVRNIRFNDDVVSYDERLLENLSTWIDAIDRPSVLILHMMGSHGPAYFRRYPATSAAFTPDCKDVRFSHCKTEEIVNAYDNTIVHTDRVLAQLIAQLTERESTVPSAMIYMSDHGESLGENNIYLHGMPYALAPDNQKHVPLIFWSTKRFAAETGLSLTCLKDSSAATASHDNLFHSVLGLMDVKTQRYDHGLDLFAKCRGPAP